MNLVVLILIWIIDAEFNLFVCLCRGVKEDVTHSRNVVLLRDQDRKILLSDIFPFLSTISFFPVIDYNLTFIHRQHAIWIAFTDFLVLNLCSVYPVVIAWNKCSDFVWILYFEEWHLAEVIYSSISYTFNSDYWMHVYAIFEEMQSVHKTISIIHCW